MNASSRKTVTELNVLDRFLERGRHARATPSGVIGLKETKTALLTMSPPEDTHGWCSAQRLD
jgi:hypothetical protein